MYLANCRSLNSPTGSTDEAYFYDANSGCGKLYSTREQGSRFLKDMRMSEFGRGLSSDSEQWQQLRFLKSQWVNFILQVEATSSHLPPGALMKGPTDRCKWSPSQLVSLATLTDEIARSNKLPIKGALQFLRVAVTSEKRALALYKVGEGAPFCIGSVEWVVDFHDSLAASEESESTALLQAYALDPVEAEHIFMEYPFAPGSTPKSDGVFTFNRDSLNTIEEKKSRIDAFAIKADEMEATGSGMITALVKHKPKEFLQWCCKCILNEENPLDRLLSVREKNQEGLERRKARFGYLARAALRKLDEQDLPKNLRNRPEEDGPYMTLGEMIFEEMHGHWEYIHPDIVRGRQSEGQFLSAIFDYVRQSLDSALVVVTEKIWQGVPLYVRDQQGMMKLAPSTDEHYVYFRMCGKQGGMTECYEPPEWVESYFVAHKDIEVHAWLFNYDGLLTDSEMGERRAALAKQLDLPAAATTQNDRPHTTLLGLAELVRQRYYAKNFDPMDRDTFPKQTVVIEWLRRQHNLSERQAAAVEIVTRPELARRN